MDSRKEDHPPFYVSLMIGDLLLHNCMLDSGSSSNVMTKKVMDQLKLRPTRPYQNICAMDYREVDVVGLIQNFPVRLDKYPSEYPYNHGHTSNRCTRQMGNALIKKMVDRFRRLDPNGLEICHRACI